MKTYCAMITLAVVMVCSLCSGAWAGAIAIDNLAYHEATSGDYESDDDGGGVLYAFVRNISGATETMGTIKLNGTDLNTLQSNGTVKWWRTWPATIAAGEYSSITIKGNGAPFAVGNAVTVEAWTASGQYASASGTNSMPLLRLGSLVPSQDRKTLYLYLRNLDSTSYTVNQVYMNENVTAQCTFVGGTTIYSQGVMVIKIAYPTAQPLQKSYAIRVQATRAGGGTYWVGAHTRLVEGWFPIGTWSSSLYTNTVGLQYARRMHIDLAVTGASDMRQRYFIKTIVEADTTNPASISGNANDTGLGVWMVEDEPDINGKTSTEMATRTAVYWNNDPNHPTWLNIARQKRTNEFCSLTDIVGIDHYAFFSAPNCIANTWVTRYAQPYEAIDWSEVLKENTEPRRMWNWVQVAADGTWSTQPPDWAADYQFWGTVMTGAKGILWFKYGPGYESDADTSAQTAEAERLGRQLNQVKGLCLYSDVSSNMYRSTTDVKGRVLVGEDAVTAIIVNNNIDISGLWWSPSYSTHTVTGQIVVYVPAWIPIEQVRQITPDGPVTPSYTVNPDHSVTIDFSVRYDSAVYVIGRNDTTPPNPPTCLNLAEITAPNQFVLSWKEPFDNYGILGYHVYANGTYIGSTQAPYLSVTPADPGNTDYTVAAYDMAGNVSATSQPVRIGCWKFDDAGYAYTAAPVQHVTNWNVADGALKYDTAGSDPAISLPTTLLDSGQFRFIKIRLKNSSSSQWGKVYWISNVDGVWNETKSIRFRIDPNSNYKEYYVYLDGNAAWNNYITQFSLHVPDDGYSGHIEIDSFDCTVNPPPVTAWYFSQSGNTEGWTAGNNCTTPTVSSGILYYTNTGTDAFIYGPRTWFPAATYRYVKIKLRNASVGSYIQLFWATDIENWFSDSKHVDIPVKPSDTTSREYVFDMATLPGWSGNVTRLRFDSANEVTSGQEQISEMVFSSTNPDTTPPTTPDAPTDAGEYSLSNSLTFNWTAATDPWGTGIGGYRVHIWRTDIAWGQPGSDVGPGLIGNTTTYTLTGALNGKTYKAMVVAVDKAGNESSGSDWSDGITVDTTNPTIPSGVSASPEFEETVRVAWNASTDNVGVKGYKLYRGGVYINSTSALEFTDTGLGFGAPYSYYVRSVDSAGRESGNSTSVQATTYPAAEAVTVGSLKSRGDDAQVSLDMKVVTASFANALYIQEPDSWSGIKVTWAGAVAEGRAVRLVGNMKSESSGERYIEVDDLLDKPGSLVKPVALPTRYLGGEAFLTSGGSGQPGVEFGWGLNNIGLLVTVWGKVTAHVGETALINDGSGITDPSGHPGIRVLCSGLTKPSVGSFVTVTGISVVTLDGSTVLRAVRPRRQADIR